MKAINLEEKLKAIIKFNTGEEVSSVFGDVVGGAFKDKIKTSKIDAKLKAIIKSNTGEEVSSVFGDRLSLYDTPIHDQTFTETSSHIEMDFRYNGQTDIFLPTYITSGRENLYATPVYGQTFTEWYYKRDDGLSGYGKNYLFGSILPIDNEIVNANRNLLEVAQDNIEATEEASFVFNAIPNGAWEFIKDTATDVDEAVNVYHNDAAGRRENESKPFNGFNDLRNINPENQEDNPQLDNSIDNPDEVIDNEIVNANRNLLEVAQDNIEATEEASFVFNAIPNGAWEFIKDTATDVLYYGAPIINLPYSIYSEFNEMRQDPSLLNMGYHSALIMADAGMLYLHLKAAAVTGSLLFVGGAMNKLWLGGKTLLNFSEKILGYDIAGEIMSNTLGVVIEHLPSELKEIDVKTVSMLYNIYTIGVLVDQYKNTSLQDFYEFLGKRHTNFQWSVTLPDVLDRMLSAKQGLTLEQFVKLYDPNISPKDEEEIINAIHKGAAEGVRVDSKINMMALYAKRPAVSDFFKTISTINDVICYGATSEHADPRDLITPVITKKSTFGAMVWIHVMSKPFSFEKKNIDLNSIDASQKSSKIEARIQTRIQTTDKRGYEKTKIYEGGALKVTMRQDKKYSWSEYTDDSGKLTSVDIMQKKPDGTPGTVFQSVQMKYLDAEGFAPGIALVKKTTFDRKGAKKSELFFVDEKNVYNDSKYKIMTVLDKENIDPSEVSAFLDGSLETLLDFL